MKSWRTGLAGIGAALASVAGILTLLGNSDGQIDWNAMAPLIAALAASVSNAIGLFVARDNKVSSQDVGIRNDPPPLPKMTADAIARSKAP